MNEEAATRVSAADPVPGSQPTGNLARAIGRHPLMLWAGELFTVFIGVYAAFFLNNYAGHRHEQQRRAQLLGWVEDHYGEVLDTCRTQSKALRGRLEEFQSKVDSGQTPKVIPFEWQGDYDPTDMTSLLQSGGYDLLDVKTVRDIQEVESSARQIVSIAGHAQQRSDSLILPNLSKDPAAFYDPATHQLLAPYEWLPKVYKQLAGQFETLQGSIDKLLVQVHAERERDR